MEAQAASLLRSVEPGARLRAQGKVSRGLPAHLLVCFFKPNFQSVQLVFVAERTTFFAEQSAGFHAIELSIQHFAVSCWQGQLSRLFAPNLHHSGGGCVALLALPQGLRHGDQRA